MMFAYFLSRSESGALCVRGVHSSNKHCVAVYRPISMRFSEVFHNGLLFQMQYTILIFIAGATIFANCGQKFRKVQKSAEKFVCTTSYR